MTEDRVSDQTPTEESRKRADIVTLAEKHRNCGAQRVCNQGITQTTAEEIMRPSSETASWRWGPVAAVETGGKSIVKGNEWCGQEACQ